MPKMELPNADEGGGSPFGVKEGRPLCEGGGPAGVVEGWLRVERRSGVDGGSDEPSGKAKDIFIGVKWSTLSSMDGCKWECFGQGFARTA